MDKEMQQFQDDLMEAVRDMKAGRAARASRAADACGRCTGSCGSVAVTVCRASGHVGRKQ